MQSVTKKIDEKVEIINKIQFNLKKKKNYHTALTDNSNIELPPIVNAVSSHKHKTDSFYHQYNPLSLTKKQIKKEMDTIINDTLSHFKDHQINKIIFANPHTNRMSLGKTFFRSSLYSTIDSKNDNRKSQAKDKRLTSKRQQTFDISFSPIKLREREVFGQTCLNVKEQSHNHHFNGEHDLSFYTYPEQIQPIAKRMHRGKRRNQLKNIKLGTERYSPWKNDQDEELIV